jgi:superfamily II DNA or RNA helicase
MNQKYWIEYLDPVESRMSRELTDIMEPYISYRAAYYKDTHYRKIRKEYTVSMIISRNKKEGDLFYSGLIPKILNMGNEKRLDIHFVPPPKSVPETLRTKAPDLPESLMLRDFQKDLINSAIQKERGVLQAPTGTGKTVLGLALISLLKEIPDVSESGILWLCHTLDLMKQTYLEGVKFFGEDNVGTIGGGSYQDNKFLTISTRQSFQKLTDKLGTKYAVVLVDEVHHLTSVKGEYAKILRLIPAPLRFGLTATPHTEPGPLLTMESLIGPLIGKLTINEGRKLGFMAEPKIKITKLPYNPNMRLVRKYSDVYDKAIVRNLTRNKIIVDLIGKYEEEGKSILVIVNQITHGELLMNLCNYNGRDAEFIYGDTESSIRENARLALNNKGLQCVICTVVWKEGVNIPELDVLINAAGGKSEIATLQSIGRGMRKTKTKENLIIHDFFDPSHNYLIAHFGHRISLYMDMGWM